MTISIGADHTGYDMKTQLIEVVQDVDRARNDVGALHPDKPDDYPDYAVVMAEAIRSGFCHDYYSAHQGVEHDDMDVLVLGARIIGPMMAQDATESFLKAAFSGEERHVRRLDKVKGIENNEFR